MGAYARLSPYSRRGEHFRIDDTSSSRLGRHAGQTGASGSGRAVLRKRLLSTGRTAGARGIDDGGQRYKILSKAIGYR